MKLERIAALWFFLDVFPGLLCLMEHEDKSTNHGLGRARSHVWVGTRTSAGPRLAPAAEVITAVIGDSAFLPCTVHNLGDRTVTWMRQRDLHILTAGSLTYSADDRFRVLHPENSDDWTLHIKKTQPRDAGLYECQINSDPKLSRPVTLSVKEPSQLDDPGMFMETTDPRFPDYRFELDYSGWNKFRKPGSSRRQATAPTVSIEGPAERYIQEGSVLALMCLVSHPRRRAPAHLLWFREYERLDYNSDRGGISVQTEKMPSRTISRLTIFSVDTKDSGEYSCSPTDLPTAVVTVHVQDGQYQAAVHQSVQSWAEQSRAAAALWLLPFLLCLQSAALLCCEHRTWC